MKLLAALLVTVLAPAAALCQDAQPAREIILAVARAEADAARGRVTIAVTDRRGERKPLETASESRKRIGGTPGGAAEGTLLYGPEGWIKDLAVPTTAQTPKPMRTRTAQSAGVLRNLMQVSAGGKEEAFGRVLRVPATNPGDAILTRSAAINLEQVSWSSAKAEGEFTVIEGKRGSETHHVTIAQKPFPHVQIWTMTRMVLSPDGRSLEQTYECHVSTNESGFSKVEEWMTVGTPINSVTLRVTEVKKTEVLSELKPDELQLRFPKGTQVVDTRGEVPLEYEQTADGINDAEVAAAARALAEGRVKVGDAVPSFELKDAKNKITRLEDLRGQVVVLFWFSSASAPAASAAPGIEALQDRFKKKGVRILGLNVAETEDPIGKAEAFRKRFKWSFPVFVDPDGATVHRIGLVAGVPKIAVIDRAGKLVYAQPGADHGAVRDLLERLTAAGSGE